MDKRRESHDLNNRSTKTFFKFSYKKYRFHFGIYIPCSHFIYPENTSASTSGTQPSDVSLCSLPSPVVFSQHPKNDRKGCCKLQKFIPFYHNIPFSPNDDDKNNTKLTRLQPLKKLHSDWFNRTVKHHYSPRTGCSFDTRSLREIQRPKNQPIPQPGDNHVLEGNNTLLQPSTSTSTTTGNPAVAPFSFNLNRARYIPGLTTQDLASLQMENDRNFVQIHGMTRAVYKHWDDFRPFYRRFSSKSSWSSSSSHTSSTESKEIR
ncbi:hypothetical protein RclHR1_25470002 [Rhizophagus clarus]|uniref:Uncharacterized protein n=1 Tax=Rhizophagus clarus TaxID=94130 RepID=A0A2Z6R0N2_9GLOM|nr:hypothetical protein RclHR1_25470002 [Rhizophagus clarus]